MFLSALQPYVVAIIISLIVLQYAYALFCLLKLAYMDIDKRTYILWNLFILIVVYIGCTVFLVYYFKHPELRLKKSELTEADGNAPDDAVDGENEVKEVIDAAEAETGEDNVSPENVTAEDT